MNKPENYAAFYSLLNRMHDPDKEALKKSIVSDYTSGRTTSLKEMTMREYLLALKGMERATGINNRGHLRQKRSAVLHQMQLYGIDTADWSRINAFCKDTRIAGKAFSVMDELELDALLVKLRIIRRKEKTVNYKIKI